MKIFLIFCNFLNREVYSSRLFLLNLVVRDSNWAKFQIFISMPIGDKRQRHSKKLILWDVILNLSFLNKYIFGKRFGFWISLQRDICIGIYHWNHHNLNFLKNKNGHQKLEKIYIFFLINKYICSCEWIGKQVYRVKKNLKY